MASIRQCPFTDPFCGSLQMTASCARGRGHRLSGRESACVGRVRARRQSLLFSISRIGGCDRPGAERWGPYRAGPVSVSMINVSTFAGCFALRLRSIAATSFAPVAEVYRPAADRAVMGSIFRRLGGGRPGSTSNDNQHGLAHAGSCIWNVAPPSAFADAVRLPPCASTIERLIARPIPMPSRLVV